MDIRSSIPQFKEIVLGHLLTTKDDVWTSFRRRAAAFEGDVRAVAPDYEIAPDETRKSVLDSAVTEDSGPSLKEILGSSRKFKDGAIPIGDIDGQPVYCIENIGVYVWGRAPESPLTLSFWATFPAYPSGW